MDFFEQLEEILQEGEPSVKIEKFTLLYQQFQNNTLDFNHQLQSKVFTEPSFTKVCKVVSASEVPKRKALTTPYGQSVMLHAIAHIEYSAIDLALDSAYRFKDMPMDFYADWLEVASDEIRHFLMLEALLHKVDTKYGDIPVHAFLFDTSMRTLDLTSRIATVPRYLEASGLDANPKMIDKLKHHKTELSYEIARVLETILEEEIDHVRKGDKWFKWACEKYDISPESYFDIVERAIPTAKNKKPYVNVEFRKRAGFSCAEIAVISELECNT